MNILDLVDAANISQPVKVFNSLEDLRAYTREHGKFFPLENAYSGGVLKFLLRPILNPYEGASRGKGRGSRGGRGRGRARARASGRGRA